MTTELSFWNPDGLLRARNYEDDQNMLLRNAYYDLASWSSNGQLFLDSLNAIEKMNFDGRYAQHPYTTPDLDVASHDEMTAILYFYAITKSKHHHIKEIKIGYYIKYYQIIFHLLACKHRSNFCSFLSSIYLLLSTYFKNPNDTDGELLAILKLATIEILGLKPYFKRRILKRIAKNWGENYFKALIDAMLWYAPEHPLRQLRL